MSFLSSYFQKGSDSQRPSHQTQPQPQSESTPSPSSSSSKVLLPTSGSMGNVDFSASGVSAQMNGPHHGSVSTKNYSASHKGTGLGINASGPYASVGVQHSDSTKGVDAQVGLAQVNATHQGSSSSSSIGLSMGMGGGLNYHPEDSSGQSGVSGSIGPLNFAHKSQAFTKGTDTLGKAAQNNPDLLQSILDGQDPF